MPEQKPSVFSSAVALIGFIIILVIIVWGLVHIASLTAPWFSSLFKVSPPTAQQTTNPVHNLPAIAITSNAPTPIPQPATPAPVQPSSPADLYVRIISASADQYGNGTLTFDISNIGGSTSNVYSFTSELPTQTGYVYTSGPQTPLSPGSHIVDTLTFTQAVRGYASVSLAGTDAYQANNFASAPVSMPYYNNYNYAPQPYVY